MMLTSALPSPLSPAAVFADLASIAVEQDQAIDIVERKVRGRLRTLEAQADRAIAAFLGQVERMIDSERRGQLELSDQELTAEINEVFAAETDLKVFLRPVERTFRQLANVAMRDGKGRRDIVRLAGREFTRILSRFIAGMQEGRWMLMGIQDGREPRGSGVIVGSPQELRRLLTTP